MYRYNDRRYDQLWDDLEQNTNRSRDTFGSNAESLQQVVPRHRNENSSTQRPSGSSRSTGRGDDYNDNSMQQMVPRRRNEASTRRIEDYDDANLGGQMSRFDTSRPRREAGQVSRLAQSSVRRPTDSQRSHSLWNDDDDDEPVYCESRQPTRQAQSSTRRPTTDQRSQTLWNDDDEDEPSHRHRESQQSTRPAPFSTRRPAYTECTHSVWDNRDDDGEEERASRAPRSTASIAPSRRRVASPSPSLPRAPSRRTHSPGPFDDQSVCTEGGRCGGRESQRSTRHDYAVEHDSGCEYCFPTRSDAKWAARAYTLSGEPCGVVFNEHIGGQWGLVFYD